MSTNLFNLGPAIDRLIATQATILSIVASLQTEGTKTMAAIDDLNAAVAALQTEVAVIATQMDTLLADLNAALAGGDTAAVEAAAQAIQAQVATLQEAATRDAPPAAPLAPTGP